MQIQKRGCYVTVLGVASLWCVYNDLNDGLMIGEEFGLDLLFVNCKYMHIQKRVCIIVLGAASLWCFLMILSRRAKGVRPCEQWCFDI